MGLKLTNFASTTLAAPVGSSDTTISVASTTGALFPTLSGGDWFPVVCVAASGNPEVMKCTARSGDVLTVTRGQEGTSARTFNSGDRVDLRLTAAAIAVYALLSALATVATSGAYADLSGKPSLGALAALNLVETADIDTGAVVTAALADAAVTLAKMANLTDSTIIGRAVGDGTGVPELLTPTQVTAFIATLAGDTGTGGTKGLVPAPAMGDAPARKFLSAAGGWAGPSLAPDIILEEQQGSGTNGQDVTSGSDNTRVLNQKVRDALSICSLSANQFTISEAGTYYVEWSAPAAGGDNAHQSMLYDATAAATLKRGTSEYNANGTPGPQTRSEGHHVFTISASNKYEIRHRFQTSRSGGGGFAGSFGTEEYTYVKIWKIA